VARSSLRPYRQILVPVSARGACDEATAIACRLAADRGAVLTLLTVLEVPAELPLEAQMPTEEGAGRRVLAKAHALAELYGVRASTRVVRARSAAEAIVRCAAAGDAEIVVLGAPRRRRGNRRAPVFGRTVGAVLAQAPCRVVVAAR
jgi:nucleotide-binding universal stress UspA family protein